MRRAACVLLPHHAVDQQTCGTESVMSQMRPGDLLFYVEGESTDPGDIEEWSVDSLGGKRPR